MDIEKLIEQLSARGLSNGSSLGYHSGLFDEAATALSTLQAENEKLRAEVESLKKGYCAGCSIPAVKAEQIRDLTDAPKLRAELEQVKMECDAAKSTLAERIGVRGAEPITTAFGLPIDRLRELAKADREGRCVVLNMPRKPLVWGDDDQNTCLCFYCGRDLMGIPYGERMVLQCPECGQYLDATKVITRAEASARLKLYSQ